MCMWVCVSSGASIGLINSEKLLAQKMFVLVNFDGVCVSSGPWESSDLRGKRRGKSELSSELIKTSDPSACI